MSIYFGSANNNGGCVFHFAMTLTSVAVNQAKQVSNNVANAIHKSMRKRFIPLTVGFDK